MFMTVSAADLCESVWPVVVRFVTGATGDPELAKDISQEALARTLARHPGFDGIIDLRTYALRVASNLVKDEFRRRTVRRRLLLAWPDKDAQGGHEAAITQSLSLWQYLNHLPYRQRFALSLRYGADLSVAEAARVMACAEGTIKALCHQGIQQLRREVPASLRET